MPDACLVARRQRDQRERLAGEVSQGGEDLAARGSPCRIDRRPDEDHRPDLLRSGRGELGHDLAPHRVGDDGGTGETVRLEPAPECRGQRPEGRLPRQRAAFPLSRQIGCKRRE